MKLFMTAMAAIAIFIAPAKAFEKSESANIDLYVQSYVGSKICGFTTNAEKLHALADLKGADRKRLDPEIEAAIKALSEEPYDSDELVGVVTRQVNVAMDNVFYSMEKNREKECHSITDFMSSNDLLL